MSTYTVIFIAALVLGLYLSHRYAWWKKGISYKYPRILMYHMIREPIQGAKFNSLRVSPKNFEKQISYLNENGWRFFTMSELINSRKNLPEKSVAITFDDGYEDNLTNALPILKKYNAKATIYLVVDRHNREWSSKRKKKNNNNELMREPKLQDEQVQHLIQSGLIEIGSHTLTHDNLPTLTIDEKQKEIVVSRNQIRNQFNIGCESFCYPFGLFDEKDLQLVEKAGYTNATTVEKGITENIIETPFLLKRITVSGKDNLYAFQLKLRTGKRGIRK